MSKGTRGDPNSHRTKCQNVTKREKRHNWAASSSEEPEATRRPDRRSRNL